METTTHAHTVMPTPSYLPSISPEAVEHALAVGDLAQMSPQQRVAYYIASCESLGLNPLTRPFDALKGQDGKYRLYANAMAAEQLRKKYRVSIKVIERRHDKDTGLYCVTVQATTPDGREEESQGIVEVSNLKGQALANAMMKAESKSKRRVTMAICGLGYQDIPAAVAARFDTNSGALDIPNMDLPVLASTSQRDILTREEVTEVGAQAARELFGQDDAPHAKVRITEQEAKQAVIQSIDNAIAAKGYGSHAIDKVWADARAIAGVETEIDISLADLHILEQKIAAWWARPQPQPQPDVPAPVSDVDADAAETAAEVASTITHLERLRDLPGNVQFVEAINAAINGGNWEQMRRVIVDIEVWMEENPQDDIPF